MTYDEGDSQPETILSAEVVETLQWCLRVFAMQDEAMAALHLSVVRYSPITCSVAQSLHTIMEYQPLHYWPEGSKELADRVVEYCALFGAGDSPLSPPPA